MDRARFEVLLAGQRVHLTKKEFDLSGCMIRNLAGGDPRRDSGRLWDYDGGVETRTVDVHIRALRRNSATSGSRRG